MCADIVLAAVKTLCVLGSSEDTMCAYIVLVAVKTLCVLTLFW